MNILAIGSNYKPNNGGNAKRVSTMCEEFVRLGHRVFVCTCSAYESAPREETIEGVTVYRFADANAIAHAVEDMVDALEIDVVFAHDEMFLRKLNKKKLGTSVVYECHAIEPDPRFVYEQIKRILRRKLYGSVADAVFVLSRNAKKELCKQYGIPESKVFFTPNGVQKTKHSDKPMRFGDRETFVYGYAGTLYDFQGIRILIEYCKDILAIAEDVRIMIVGGGSLESFVRDYIEQNDLAEKVIFTGSVSQERFDELVAAFDVMLMPRPSTQSTESAVPLKIFDAVIHKKPVVMSNVSGLTEAFDDRAALIYDKKTPADFVDCCRKIYRNHTLAEQLVRGSEDALAAWPTVTQTAQWQLGAMEQAMQGRREK